MRIIKFAVFAFCMFCASSAFAQSDLSQMSNKELSQHFGQEIDILNQKIKLVKMQLKADKDNKEHQSEMSKLQVELKKAKDNKKIIDNAIKTEQKANAAIKNAEKMQKKAEEAKQKAEEMKDKAAEAARKAIQVRG